MTPDTHPSKPTSRNPILRILRAPFFSPMGFLTRALAIALIFALMTRWGWRDYTSVICGTAPSGNLADKNAILIGMSYAVVHFVSYVGTPILLLAAGIQALLERRFAHSSPETPVPVEGEKTQN
jgi:hypothetical protein